MSYREKINRLLDKFEESRLKELYNFILYFYLKSGAWRSDCSYQPVCDKFALGYTVGRQISIKITADSGKFAVIFIICNLYFRQLVYWYYLRMYNIVIDLMVLVNIFLPLHYKRDNISRVKFYLKFTRWFHVKCIFSSNFWLHNNYSALNVKCPPTDGRKLGSIGII